MGAKMFLKKLCFFFFGICFSNACLAVETYCQSPNIVLYDGADHSIEWIVTTMKARKIQKIGQQKPTRGCSRDFNPNGMVLKREVLVPAKLGTFRTINSYSVYYESEKAGVDEVAYRTTWEFGGKVSSAIVRIKVRVIDSAI
jgi:hypothetical protein